MKRDVNTGEIIDFREVMNDQESQNPVFLKNKELQAKSKLDIGSYADLENNLSMLNVYLIHCFRIVNNTTRI